MKKFVLIVALFTFGAAVSFAQNAPTQAAKTEKPAGKKKSAKTKKAAKATESAPARPPRWRAPPPCDLAAPGR